MNKNKNNSENRHNMILFGVFALLVGLFLADYVVNTIA